MFELRSAQLQLLCLQFMRHVRGPTPAHWPQGHRLTGRGTAQWQGLQVLQLRYRLVGFKSAISATHLEVMWACLMRGT